jgi:hypothetical protein
MHTISDSWRTTRNLPLHPGINYSKTDVGGDLGGLVFAVGSVIAVLIGLPMLIPMYAAAVALGVLLAFGLAAWYHRHPLR